MDVCIDTPRPNLYPLRRRRGRALGVPRLAKVELECGAHNVEPEEREEVAAEQGQEGREEELASRDEGQRRVAEVGDVDVLEAGDEEEGAAVSESWWGTRRLTCRAGGTPSSA